MAALLVAAIAFCFAGVVLADGFSTPEGVPHILAYEGYLEKDGVPATAQVSLSFRIFDRLSGGMELWPISTNVTRTLTPQQGRFAVRLGDDSNGAADPALPASLFSGGDAWLQVTVDNTAVMPRQRLTSAPYAQRAAHARRAETVSPSGVYTATNCTAGGNWWEMVCHCTAGDVAIAGGNIGAGQIVTASSNMARVGGLTSDWYLACETKDGANGNYVICAQPSATCLRVTQ